MIFHQRLNRVAPSCGLLVAVLLLVTPLLATVPESRKVDKVLVFKHDHELRLLNHGKVIKSYKVALGGDPVGPKMEQGDHKTPEGTYTLDRRNANSKFHRALHISYPNAKDREQARKRGVAPGGDIMLHGLPNGYGAIGAAHRLKDWTDGCIAVTNAEIEEIWTLVPDGTPIEIRP
jgi:murein L,D-transpeptidase YafK